MKVCYKAGAVTAQNHYYSIAADAVEIRVWFLTDDIIRIRVLTGTGMKRPTVW